MNGIQDSLKKEKLGIAVAGRPFIPPEDIISLLEGYGAGVVEINDNYFEAYPDSIKAFQANYLEVTAHVPHNNHEYHPLSKDPEIKNISIKNIVNWIKEKAVLGITMFTVHLMDPAHTKVEDFWDEAVEVGRHLGYFAAELGVRIGFENCYRMVSNGPISRRFYKAVDNLSVGHTLDVGHFWSALDLDEYGNKKKEKNFLGKPEGIKEMDRMIIEMVDYLGKKIFHFHLHDIWESNWKDHHSIGSGVIDYPSLLSKLIEIGYRETMVIEIMMREGEGISGLKRSLDYLISTEYFK